MRVTRRQRVLLALLDMLGGSVSSLQFQKLLFCFFRLELTEGDTPLFEFIPHIKGGYSFTAQCEKANLTSMGFLEEGKQKWNLIKNAKFPKPRECDLRRLRIIMNSVGDLSEEELVERVYIEAPEYAIRSIIASKVLMAFPNVMQEVQQYKKELATRVNHDISLYTIGYEGISIEEFFERLQQAAISCLVDVRRIPFSHKMGFSKNKLADLCAATKIIYKHIPELGIPSHRRRTLKTQVDYDLLFEEYLKYDLPQKESQLAQIVNIITRGERVALMCFEADPMQCHRRIVAERLSEMLGHPYQNLLTQVLPTCQPTLAFSF